MIKNYIFDFGKVIVDFEPDIIMRPYVESADDRDYLGKILFDRRYWDRLDDGSMTEADVISSVKKIIPEEYGETAEKILNNWYYNLPLFIETARIIRDIKEAGGRIFLLSNISLGFAENYEKIDNIKEVFSLFEGFVFSASEGIVKPKREIFELLLNRYGLAPEETLFIDDSPRNIAGADALRIKTFLFNKNYDELRNLIALS